MSTTPIPRWDEGGMYDAPYLDDDGDWVLWADHARALAAAYDRNNALMAKVRILNDTAKEQLATIAEQQRQSAALRDFCQGHQDEIVRLNETIFNLENTIQGLQES